ncbi:MAG: phosphatase PAP2 family protein [Solirubrobacterales bacterium]
MRRSRTRPSPVLRAAVRAGAGACLLAAAAVPFVRRRRRIPVTATIVACVSGPLAIAVLRPRSKPRDVALFAGQMWAFTAIHELPYDDPERLRRRLLTRYPIAVDRRIGLGRLPNARLQSALSERRFSGALDRVLSWVHWLWFIEPYLALIVILVRHNERFPRAARQMAAAFDIGCAAYFLVPTAPPWWASEQGVTSDPVRRIMVGVGEETWGPAWESMYGALGGNPWAAMPSLHFGTALLAALLLTEAGPKEGALGWGYAGALGFALVYLGEHYVTDLLAGALLVAAVRRGEPLAEPVVEGVNRVIRRLEAIAA